VTPAFIRHGDFAVEHDLAPPGQSYPLTSFSPTLARSTPQPIRWPSYLTLWTNRCRSAE
jgi:hypothetical protein